jgi:hypothetical protein
LPAKFKTLAKRRSRFWETRAGSPPLFLGRALAFKTKAFQIVLAQESMVSKVLCSLVQAAARIVTFQMKWMAAR